MRSGPRAAKRNGAAQFEHLARQDSTAHVGRHLLRCDVAWLLGLGRNAECSKIGSIPTHGANFNSPARSSRGQYTGRQSLLWGAYFNGAELGALVPVIPDICKKRKPNSAPHRIYRKGADPWDYVPDELMTLCEACHEQEHNIADKLKEILCIASSNQVPTGWIAALLLGFIETHVRNDETFDPGVIDKYWEVAEEYPSAYLAGQEARDRLMAIAVEMGQMSRG